MLQCCTCCHPPPPNLNCSTTSSPALQQHATAPIGTRMLQTRMRHDNVCGRAHQYYNDVHFTLPMGFAAAQVSSKTIAMGLWCPCKNGCPWPRPCTRGSNPRRGPWTKYQGTHRRAIQALIAMECHPVPLCVRLFQEQKLYKTRGCMWIKHVFYGQRA